MQRGGVVHIGGRGFGKARGDLLFAFAQDDARLALAFGLRLAAHRVFQVLRDDHVADLDRLHGDAPRRGAFVDDLLQIRIHFIAPDQDVGQRHLPDHLAQRGLGSPGNGHLVVFHLQGGLLGVPHHPEQHRVHVHRHGIAGERLFGAEGRHHHALVHPDGDRINQRHQPEQARPAQPVELAQAQHHGLFPLARHAQRVQQHEAHQHQAQANHQRPADGRVRLVHVNGQADPEQDEKDAQKQRHAVQVGFLQALLALLLRAQRAGRIDGVDARVGNGFLLHGYLTAS